MLKYGKYSYSKINQFHSCPYKFKLKHIDKVKAKVHVAAFDQGKYYHHYLEHFPNDPPKEFNGATLTSEDKERLRTNLLQFVDIPYIHDLLCVHSIAREKKFNYGLFDETADEMTGYVDYIGQLRPRAAIVVDWKKSGSYKPSPLQLKIYGVWLFGLIEKLEEIEARFIFIEAPEDTWTSDILTRDRLPEYKEEVINNIRSIESCTDFCKKPSKWCTNCEYFNACLPFKVGQQERHDGNVQS